MNILLNYNYRYCYCVSGSCKQYCVKKYYCNCNMRLVHFEQFFKLMINIKIIIKIQVIASTISDIEV